jgi:hypothetical protein
VIPSLHDCLFESTLFERFLVFAKHAQCEEVLVFWRAAEDFQRTTNDDGIDTQAQGIFNRYFSALSEVELCISSRTRKQIVFAVEQHLARRDMFVVAQREVYQTILDL